MQAAVRAGEQESANSRSAGYARTHDHQYFVCLH